MNRMLILAMTGLLFFEVSAQKNFRPGYILTLTGDTIQGSIDYRNWDKNPHEVTFLSNSQSEPVTYGVGDILEFGVDNEVYVGATVQTETSPSQELRLDESPALNLRTETVFLLVLIRGEKGLYYAKNTEGKENFYISTGPDFDLLVHKKYFVSQTLGGAGMIAENKKYLGQLMLYLGDCPTIQSLITKDSYDKRSLQNLFQQYYKCVRTEVSYKKNNEKAIEGGALAGASLSTIAFYSDSFDYLVKAGFDHSTTITGGLFLEIIIPRTAKKWSVNNELVYSSYRVSGQYEDFNDAMNTTSLEYKYIKINNMIRFKYPIGKLNAFINLGMSNGFAISEVNTITKAYKGGSFSSGRIVEGKALNKTKKYEQGFFAGLGSGYKKFSFEVRYEEGNGMSQYIALHSATRRLHLLLGYRF